MADAFRLRADGQDAIERRLAFILARVGNLKPLMQDIGTQLETSTDDNFDAERSPAGVPWQKSARVKRTAVGKAGPLPTTTGKTLTDSRRLRLSITSRATASSVEVGSNVVYARRHNQGFDGSEAIPAHRRILTSVFGVKLAEPRSVNVKAFARKGNTPKRQFLGLGPHDVGDIEDLAAAYLDMAP